MSGLKPMNQLDDQEKQQIIAKAQQARKLEKERLQKYADEHYRIYEDEKEWAAMAKEFGVRLPRFIDQPTKKNIRKFAKKIGKSVPWVKECWGVDNLEEIAIMNPDMSMRYVAGVCLEDLKGEEEI